MVAAGARPLVEVVRLMVKKSNKSPGQVTEADQLVEQVISR